MISLIILLILLLTIIITLNTLLNMRIQHILTVMFFEHKFLLFIDEIVKNIKIDKTKLQNYVFVQGFVLVINLNN